MHDRRAITRSFAGAIGAVLVSRAWADDQPLPPPTPEHPNAIPGKPPYLDFGNGLHVPLSKDAFLGLWENREIWITYGYGRAEHADVARARAVRFANGAMKLLLLTLAFAPVSTSPAACKGWMPSAHIW